MTLEMMEAKMEIKELVDTFSVLADEKDAKTQAGLFAEDAVLTSYQGEQKISEQHGREEIEAGCAAFLALFDTVYHMNGQQVVHVDGSHAKGKAYCQVVLIGLNEEGKRVRNMQGVWYDDEYVKKDGKWLIANRNSHFTWADVKEV